MKKLNLGCGYAQPDDPEWYNVDKLAYGQQYISNVLEGLPFPKDYFDFVLMNHTLQMFTYEELPLVLDEVMRVMKQGATLRILTPDLDKAIEAYRVRDEKYFPISRDLEGTIEGQFARYLFWHGDTRCAFNRNSLFCLLNSRGFDVEHGSKFGECELDSREEESLIMEAKK